jgi:hypothetical protein
MGFGNWDKEAVDRLTKKQTSSLLGEVVRTKAKGKTQKPPNEKLNKTEARYERHLAGLKLAGEILWYRMHAFSLYFEDGTRYSPDAVIMDVRGGITLVDCKAYRKNEKKVHIEEASMLKIKRTAEEYFMFTMKVVYEKDGAWQEIIF